MVEYYEEEEVEYEPDSSSTPVLFGGAVVAMLAAAGIWYVAWSGLVGPSNEQLLTMGGFVALPSGLLGAWMGYSCHRRWYTSAAIASMLLVGGLGGAVALGAAAASGEEELVADS
jgi:hypothetical protein